MFYTGHYDSPIGGITIASDGRALTGLRFDGQKYFADTLIGDYQDKDVPVIKETFLWLDDYFSGICPQGCPELHMQGTPFRLRVWQSLQRVPYGRVITYNDIAREIALERGIKSMSAQAVGGAVGHNPISIIVPCHRVIGSDGSLTGYAGGIERKTALLRLENAYKITGKEMELFSSTF